MKDFVISEFNGVLENLKLIEESLKKDIKKLVKFSDIITKCFLSGNKVLVFGNGGSAAQAQHFAAELVGRYEIERVALPAVSLTTDTSIITSVGNDFTFEKVFEKQIEAIGNEGDVAIGISTSGNSRNVLLALKKAKEKKLKTFAFLGRDGGKIVKEVDGSIVFRAEKTPRIQEYHEICLHFISFLVEQNFKEIKK